MVRYHILPDVCPANNASGGFLEVQSGVVTVLADTAARAEDLDEAAAIAAQEAAEKALQDGSNEINYAAASVQLAEASARLRTLAELRKRNR